MAHKSSMNLPVPLHLYAVCDPVEIRFCTNFDSKKYKIKLAQNIKGAGTREVAL